MSNANAQDSSHDKEFVLNQVKHCLDHLNDPPTKQEFHFLFLSMGPPHKNGAEYEQITQMFMRGSPQYLAKMILAAANQVGQPDKAHQYLKFINAIAVQLHLEINKFNRDVTKNN